MCYYKTISTEFYLFKNVRETKNPSSTKIGLILGLCRLPNDLISARQFEMTLDGYWRISRWFTDGQWLVKRWILHLANIIPTTEK